MKEYDDFICASEIFTQPKNRYYYLFSKGVYTSVVRERAGRENVVLVEIDGVFQFES